MEAFNNADRPDYGVEPVVVQQEQPPVDEPQGIVVDDNQGLRNMMMVYNLMSANNDPDTLLPAFMQDSPYVQLAGQNMFYGGGDTEYSELVQTGNGLVRNDSGNPVRYDDDGNMVD